MPMMTLRATNASFESRNEADYPSVGEAYMAALEAGLAIAADEVRKGAASSIIEIAVDTAEQEGAVRGAVSVSTSRILSKPPSASAD